MNSQKVEDQSGPVTEANAQPHNRLTTRIEARLAEAGLTVTVESSDGALVLSGVVPSDEARQAAADIVAQAAPDARIDNQLDVETVLPTDIDHFAGSEPTAEMAESSSDIQLAGGELEPDFTDQTELRDPIAAAGPGSSQAEDAVESGDEVYTPPNDPVLSTDAYGAAHVLGGFGTDHDVTVERSSDGRTGDEALADAVRQELAEDAATTDLNILVAVRNGVAHLRGQVPDLEDADNAESVAARVPGIREVVEELEVVNI
jgi:osmotically-inducible protein OsmY